MRTGRLAASCAAAAFAALTMAALSAVGCGISDPSNAHTDTFSGTLQVGGKSPVYSFSVSDNGGEVNIKVTSIAPDSGTALGIAYGTAQSGTGDCIPISQSGAATQGKTAITNTIIKGTYCLVVFDSGFLQHAESYTVTVSHP